MNIFPRYTLISWYTVGNDYVLYVKRESWFHGDRTHILRGRVVRWNDYETGEPMPAEFILRHIIQWEQLIKWGRLDDIKRQTPAWEQNKT